MNEVKDETKNIPKISIGLPVYNGEKFIRNRIESILKQTFQDFEIIISNNASTDSTEKICIELEKKDERIKYFKQKSNIGGMPNFNFVLSKATCEFFVWAAVDDIWDQEFLKINYEFLKINKEYVGCVTKEELIDSMDDEIYIKNFSKIRKILRNKLYAIRPNLYPINGKYYKKIRSILKSKSSNMMYGLMKTECLKKSMINERFLGDEWPIMFNIVKYGNYFEIDKKMLFRREYGASWSGILDLARKFNHDKLGVIFPNYPLTIWCLKNFKKNVFIKNLDQILIINLEAELAIILDVLLRIKNKLKKQRSA
jgi:glycosyltransferase involved in cell wall biosynthesis